MRWAQAQAAQRQAQQEAAVAENPAAYMRWAQMEAKAYQKKLDETECLDILRLVDAVSLRIARGMYELRKRIAPESHSGGVLTEFSCNLANCVAYFFHIV